MRVRVGHGFAHMRQQLDGRLERKPLPRTGDQRLPLDPFHDDERAAIGQGAGDVDLNDLAMLLASFGTTCG